MLPFFNPTNSLVLFSLSTMNLLCRTVEILVSRHCQLRLEPFLSILKASIFRPYLSSCLDFLPFVSGNINCRNLPFVYHVPMTPSYSLFLFQNVYNYNHMDNTFGPPCSVSYFVHQVFAF